MWCVVLYLYLYRQILKRCDSILAYLLLILQYWRTICQRIRHSFVLLHSILVSPLIILSLIQSRVGIIFSLYDMYIFLQMIFVTNSQISLHTSYYYLVILLHNITGFTTICFTIEIGDSVSLCVSSTAAVVYKPWHFNIS